MNTVTPEAPRRSVVDRIREGIARWGRLACTTRAPYQSAVFRIGLALVIAAFLLREWPQRRVLYGDRSPLSYDMALELGRMNDSFSVLNWSGGRAWFEIVYALTIASALAVVVGWRTRTMCVVLMVGTVSLENHNPLTGDGGDNILRIMVIYLVFTRCAQVWSLDARRASGSSRRHTPQGLLTERRHGNRPVGGHRSVPVAGLRTGNGMAPRSVDSVGCPGSVVGGQPLVP